MGGMFLDATSIASVSLPETGAVTSMSRMFRDATAFNQEIRGWNVDSVTSSGFFTMFQDAAAMHTAYGGTTGFGDTPTAAWFTDVPITDSNFRAAITACLATNPANGLCSGTGYGSMPDWDVSNVIDMSSAFRDKTNFNADLSNWDTRAVTNMSEMFRVATSIESVSLSETGAVMFMTNMFSAATSLKRVTLPKTGAVMFICILYTSAGAGE